MEREGAHPRGGGLTVAVLAGGYAAAAIAVVLFLHSELIPQFREGHFVIQMTAAAQGTSVGDISATVNSHFQRVAKAAVRASPSATRLAAPRRARTPGAPDKSEFHVELTAEHAKRDGDRGARKKSGTCSSIFPRCRPRR